MNKKAGLGALEGRLLILCLVLIGMGVALVLGLPARSVAMAEERQSQVEFGEFAELFAEIYATIKMRYVDEVNSQELFEGAINGMFLVLDEHSAWLPPEEQEMLTKDTEGEYSGVGMHIGLDENRILTVISPIIGSPAARAGVHPWDRIIEIDGESTEGISTLEAVKRLTGPTGTSVKIKVWRAGENEPLDFTIVRERIHIDSVFHQMLDDKIGYLRITRFQDDTTDAVREALVDMNEKNAKGILVDLRYNAGGLLERANEICDLFLPKGDLIVSIKGRNTSNNRDYYSMEEQLAAQPLLVLVNQFSASASEIFAGAMKDNGRGVIVGPLGETTYGKGSVQSITPLDHSLEMSKEGDYLPSAIKLTTARYYTPSGVSIHKTGIKPDIEVELPEGHDLELRRHGLLGDPSLVEDDYQNGDPDDLDVPRGEEVPEDPELDKRTIDPVRPPMLDERQLDDTQDEEKGPKSEKQEGDDPRTSGELFEFLKMEAGDENAEAQTQKDFEDILLNEAVKYLKAIILVEEGKPQAA